MDQIRIRELATKVASKRGKIGIRMAAQEIGISPATLSRIENEKIPDLETFGKLCEWLQEDPSTFLGLSANPAAPRAQVHFKKEAAIRPDSALALSEMIVLAQKALLEEEA